MNKIRKHPQTRSIDKTVFQNLSQTEIKYTTLHTTRKIQYNTIRNTRTKTHSGKNYEASTQTQTPDTTPTPTQKCRHRF